MVTVRKLLITFLFVFLIAFVLQVGAFALQDAAPAVAPAVAPVAAGVTHIAIQAKILGIAAAVFGLLQVLKQFLPLSGYGSLALNVVFSIVGVIVAVPADQLFSLQTAVSVVSAGLAAAGIHGTYSKLSS